MDIFITGLITLAAATIVFYIVLFSFIFYWRLKNITPVVVPLIFTFEFLITGFLVVSIVSIVLMYLPNLIIASGL